MIFAPLPANEAARLNAVESYDILDTPAEAAFDAITHTATLICGVPISLVTLVDRDRQWFKSAIGLPGVSETPRDFAFCAHAILGTALLEVPDTLRDHRFADNPLVTDDPNIRFYAGMPLIDAQGLALGTLCVIDRTPRRLTPAQRAALDELAKVVVLLIERSRDAQHLRYLRALDGAIFDANPDAVLVLAEDGRIIRTNERAESLFGYPREALLGRPLEILLPDRFRAGHVALRNGFATQPRAREMGAGLPLFAKRADGSEFPVDVQIGPIEGTGEARVIACVRDITEQQAAATVLAESRRQQAILEERERTAAELQETNEKLSTIIDSAPNALFAVDAKHRITIWNPMASKLFDIVPRDAIGQTLIALAPDDASPIGSATPCELLHMALADGEFQNIEIQRLASDGSVRDLAVSSVRLHAADGRTAGFLFVVRDIGQAKEIERRLRETEKLEAIGQLTGGIAHDFNNLLAVIHGNLELLAEQGVGGAATREAVSDALTACTTGASLTHRLLAFSRRQQLAPTTVDVGELAAGLTGVLRRVVEESVRIDTEIGSGPLMARIDAHQLENALINLAVNARDAMSGGGTLTIRVERAAIDENDAVGAAEKLAGRYVLLSVTDTGSGMPPDVVERALEPFFTTKPVGKGTGLGLPMVYGFVKQSGGHLSIASELGRGTTVRLYLPEFRGEAASAAMPSKPLPVAKRERTVLVVEDEPAVRKLQLRVLASLGYQTIAAIDGPTGLTALAQAPRVDLILSDVVLPGGMSGPEIAAAARRTHPGIRVIFVTGYAPADLMERYELSGARVLMKPCTRAALAHALHDAFEEAISG